MAAPPVLLFLSIPTYRRTGVHPVVARNNRYRHPSSPTSVVGPIAYNTYSILRSTVLSRVYYKKKLHGKITYLVSRLQARATHHPVANTIHLIKLFRYIKDRQRPIYIWGCGANLRGTPLYANWRYILATNWWKILRRNSRHLDRYGLVDNMPIKLRIGWGIAHRYLLSPSVGGWNRGLLNTQSILTIYPGCK